MSEAQTSEKEDVEDEEVVEDGDDSFGGLFRIAKQKRMERSERDEWNQKDSSKMEPMLDWEGSREAVSFLVALCKYYSRRRSQGPWPALPNEKCSFVRSNTIFL